MNVLFLTEEPISFSEPMVRGGQIHVRNVVEGLRRRGHDIHLVDWNDGPERSYQHSVAPQFRFVVDPLKTVKRAVRAGRSNDVDAIISKTRKTYLPGMVAAATLGVPHIVHLGSSLDPPAHGLVDVLDNASFTARVRAPHDAYFVVCDAIRSELDERGISADKIYDVRNAVDTDRFCPDPSADLPSADAARLGAIESPILGFVGSLVDYKGVFDLAEAIEQTEIQPVVLIAGGGPAHDRLKRKLGENGVFLGSVSYEQMPAVYAAMDVLVLPSHTEGLPRVLLEAGAAARPAVATRVGGTSEVINDGETGLLCPPRRPGRLAARIDELFSERDAAAMGQAARERVAGEFTWDSQYKRYERFLRDVIDRG